MLWSAIGALAGVCTMDRLPGGRRPRSVGAVPSFTRYPSESSRFPTSGLQAIDRYNRAMTVPAHHVAVLVLPGVFPLELGIAAQIFGSEPQYRLTVCTPVPARAVPTFGFTITATAGLDALSGA